MAFLPSKRINTNLMEEFEQLGIRATKGELTNLSFGRLDECACAPTNESDLDDGRVTIEMLERITGLLESGRLTEGQINSLLRELGEQELDESDDELADAARLTVKALISQRNALARGYEESFEDDLEDANNELNIHMINRINGLLDEGLDEEEIDGLIDALKGVDEPSDARTLRAATELVTRLLESKRGKMFIGGKKVNVKFKTGQELRDARKQRKQYMRSTKGKAAMRRAATKARTGTEKRRLAKVAEKAIQAKTRQESNELALELAKTLRIDESVTHSGAEREVMTRISRVFDLLKEHFDSDGITMVINEAFEGMCSKLEEGEVSFLESIKPSLRIISRMLETVEGNA